MGELSNVSLLLIFHQNIYNSSYYMDMIGKETTIDIHFISNFTSGFLLKEKIEVKEDVVLDQLISWTVKLKHLCISHQSPMCRRIHLQQVAFRRTAIDICTICCEGSIKKFFSKYIVYKISYIFFSGSHNIYSRYDSQGFNIMPLQTNLTRGYRVSYLPFTHTSTLIGIHSKMEENEED
ncbi:uncharacterized protein LOC125682419 isoform X2 [Ostrea edulis]|uniref:uncharacterized protein LOC125682419 isoform X2 n=1 Tax=Ostrea edulis TaxID=37623 RepID=UPI0024AFC05C|nr:uncharacterized protein LOC125682419 isoform X2 [Ostrea edulis]